VSTGVLLSAPRLKDFYNVKAAAAYIGIDYMALHQRIHRGTVKVERPAERMILIHKDEVERLKVEQEASSC
jgi:predicted site-specific integrase-resolvase